MDCNFTFKHYKEVLELAKKKYRFLKFKDFSDKVKDKNIIILRHDIDFSLKAAVDFARIEKKIRHLLNFFYQSSR